MDTVVLVNDLDEQIGVMEKLEAHQKGVLHRAFSVFLFNRKNELLLQQRASNKYHSANLWTNTCCSHPKPNESVEQAAKRRLIEEMGIEAASKKEFHITYKTVFDNGLIEHEFDHVLIGFFDGTPMPASSEVQNWKYISLDSLEQEMIQNPQNYTYWLKLILPQLKDKIANGNIA